jgi:site-specific recombinase XerD
MTTFDPFDIGFYLDKRQESKTYPGSFTLYLRVHSNTEGKKKYFSTKKYLTPFTWNRIQKSFLGSGSGLTVEEKEIREFLLGIRQEAQKYNDPQRAKTLKQFEDLFKRNTKTDSKSIFVYDIFEMVISEKEKAKTKASYRSAMASMQVYDKNKHLVIHDITPSWISAFKLWHQEQGSSKETANSYLRQLRHVFTHAEHTGVVLPSENPFKGLHKISIPAVKRQTKKYNLSVDQIKALVEVDTTSYEQELAKDVFFFLFMFDGLRFSDMIVLEKDWIVEDEFGKRIDFDPVKTEDRSELMGEVWITDELQSIMDKYPGKGKYIFNFLDDKMNQDQIRAKRESKLSTINVNLKKLSQKIEGMPDLSTKHARYSAASYVKKITGATTNQVSELLVNSPKMAEGYIDTPEEKKAMQSVLSDVLKKNQKSSKKSKN